MASSTFRFVATDNWDLPLKFRPIVAGLERLGVRVGMPRMKRRGDEKPVLEGFYCNVPIHLPEMAKCQRDLASAHVRAIRGNDFDPRWSQDLLLSFRDGRLLCMEGQHTCNALREEGFSEVNAIVYFGLSEATESKCFHALNTGRRAVGGWPKFKSAILAGKSEYHEMIRIVEAYGLTHGLSDEITVPKNADIPAASYLMDAKAAGGLQMVDTLCYIFHHCYRTKRGGPVSNGVKDNKLVRGLLDFLKRKWNKDRVTKAALVRILKGTSLDELRAAATDAVKEKVLDKKQYAQAFESIVNTKSGFDARRIVQVA